jgi:hypothetical protein
VNVTIATSPLIRSAASAGLLIGLEPRLSAWLS